MKKYFGKILKALAFYAILIVIWATLQYLLTDVLNWVRDDVFVSPVYVARMFIPVSYTH